MRIVIGADHRGIAAAEHLMTLLRTTDHEIDYVGPKEGERCDYPEQACLVAGEVSEGRADRGILLSGSGLGMAMTANKFDRIRAVVGHDEWTAQISRAHHDSNVLTIPTDMIGIPMIRIIVERWLNTVFEGGRHERRITKIRLVEQGHDPASLEDEVGGSAEPETNSAG